MSEETEGDKSKPDLKDRFVSVFGGLATLEAEHNKFVETEIKGGSTSDLKTDSLIDDVIDRRSGDTATGARDKRRDSSSRHDSRDRSSSYHRNKDSRERSRSDDRPSSRRFDRPHFMGYRRGQGRSKVPDYKMHPDKWVCYDLSDVDQSQLTQRSNSAAAFSFLDDIRKQKESSETRDVTDSNDDVTGSSPPGSVVFKKPLRQNRTRNEANDSRPSGSRDSKCTDDSLINVQQKYTKGVLDGESNILSDESLTSRRVQSVEQEQNCDKITFKKPKTKSSENDTSRDAGQGYSGGALLMPEYVIGAKSSKSKAKKIGLSSKSKNVKSKPEIKLSYLEDEDVVDSSDCASDGGNIC